MCRLFAFVMLISAAPVWAQLATAVASSAPSNQIPNDFMGLSMEWDNATFGGRAQTLMGTTSTGVDTIFRQLVANLALTGPVPFRIGGNSTDFFTTVAPVTAFSQLYSANGSQFWLGVNLKTATLTQAEAQASSYAANMPTGSLRGLEIGNEPDQYGWTTAQYFAGLASWVNGLHSTVSTVPLMFPSCAYFACLTAWNIPSIALQYRSYASANSFHLYPLNVTTSGSLLTSAAYAFPKEAAWQIGFVHRAGSKYRADETNSIGGGGVNGVSNAFENAIWVLDASLILASEGADGVNVHGCWISTTTSMCNFYDPATVEITAGTPNTFSLIQVWPMYYGMQAFQEALGSGNAKMHPVTVTAGTSSSVDAYDLIDSANAERAVVINRDTVNSGSVNFTPTATYSSATCYTMTAPLFSSTTGVTIHGQTYDGSTTGLISGTFTTSTLTPTAGVFAIPLAVAQAQICKFNP